MRAFAIEEFGKPGSVQEVPVPEPAEGQVRIRVAVASVNPFDNAVLNGYLKDRMEHRFPLVPGLDASGTVDALGDGVQGWKIGDEVFGSVGKKYLGEGTMGEFATMSAATIARRPASIDHSLAAAIPTAGVTAVTMADALQLSSGQVVVAVGATGGVGSYFIQVAKQRGATVVAVCSAANADYARGHGIDAIAAMNGDAKSNAGLVDQLRPGGRVASAVGSADVDALSSRGFEGTNVMGMVATSPLDGLVELLERKELTGPEIRWFPFQEAGKAFAQVATGRTRGKVVVTVA
jgi:NADPH:quinone reductase